MADPLAPPKPVAQPMAPQPQGPNVFDKQRQRIGQSFNAQAQDQGEAMKRRFAAMGTLNSGAALKMQEQQAGDIASQREAAMGGLDMQEQQAQEADLGRQFQSREAQLGRDFQGGQFDKTFALDSEMKRGQLGLAGREMDLKDQEQQYNIGGNLADRGYGLDLTQYVNRGVRDHTGRLINPNGQGLGYEQNYGVYAPSDQETAMRRRFGRGF